MPKRKVPTQDDELYVFKSNLISESTQKTIEIPNFIKEIEDQDNINNKLATDSPKFKIGGVEFSIGVRPDSPVDGFIAVHVANYSKEDQMSSVTAKSSGVEKTWEMEKVPADGNWGWDKFLSHQKYREWAQTHGDVFKLEIAVTHHRAEGDADDWSWTR